MALEINIRSNHSDRDVMYAIAGLLAASRFTAEVRYGKVKRRDKKTYTGALTVHDVRLNQSKVYCGSHPAGCENPPDPKAKKPFGGKTKFLEGADWIAFNDLLNDALDKLGASADVASFVVEIRRAECRRTRYDYHTDARNQPEWDKTGADHHYENFCGKEPPTTVFPDGTPGTPTWRAESDGDQPS